MNEPLPMSKSSSVPGTSKATIIQGKTPALPEESIRSSLEAIEASQLHHKGAQSQLSQGRKTPEELCPLRTDYQRDRDRVLHSKAFRRLIHKTQVFIAPVDDHFRTRMTHSLEVSQVSRTIAKALGLNDDLTECVALGHDLGHPPFGHAGENILNELAPQGFHHQKQSLRIVSKLENLNLTAESLDGIEGGPHFLTLEGKVVDTADRMAYLHHDVEDAKRAGLMTDADLPQDILDTLGGDRNKRLHHMVMDMVLTSRKLFETDTPDIAMSSEVTEAMFALRKWMFQNVYLKQEHIAQTDKVRRVITHLYEHFLAHPDHISDSMHLIHEADTIEQQVVDYISGMTDRFAIDAYKKLLLPNPYQRRLEDNLGKKVTSSSECDRSL